MPPRRHVGTIPAEQQETARAAGRERPSGGLRAPVPPGGIGPILETDFANTPLRVRDHRANWTSKQVGGNTFMTLDGPRWGWVPLHNHDNEHDDFLTGLSGTIVQNPEISTEDMPFTHPYGKDFEFHVAPDAEYYGLVGPNMVGSYKTSTKRAKDQFGLSVPGVIGMEWDSGMVPARYRPKIGHRVCLFGRWIVDAGHDDFHTEIHPPLLMVSAHEAHSSFQSPRARTKDATIASILTRPFLVSQQFDGRGLMGHLISEVSQVVTFQDSLMEANPHLLQPYMGMNIMMFKLRPPTPSADPRDELWVEWDLVARDRGTAIQIVRGTDNNSVRVVVVLNEAGYEDPPEPVRHKKRINLNQLIKEAGNQGNKLKAVVFASALANPLTSAVIMRGVKTIRYDPLSAPALGNPRRIRVKDMSGNQNVTKDPSQPFPVAGEIRVEWKRWKVASEDDTTAQG